MVPFFPFLGFKIPLSSTQPKQGCPLHRMDTGLPKWVGLGACGHGYWGSVGGGLGEEGGRGGGLWICGMA